MDTLSGSIERVTYHNSENGYCVLRVLAKGHKDLVTVVGHVPNITPGESIEAAGTWIQHRDFGLQFQANSLRAVHPSTLEGIEKYLGSGMVKGIGPFFAKKLVKAFGADVFDVIEQKPDELTKVEGIGPVRLQKITTAWKDQKVVRDIMVFLQSHGVSTSKSVRIYKTYGQDAIAKVKGNPYQLARDIHGIGFRSADVIAGNLGIEKTSLIRARAGVNYVLLEQVSDGHCAYPEEELLKESVTLLEIEPDRLKEAIVLETLEGNLVRDNIEGISCVYPASIFSCETEVAKLLLQLRDLAALPWDKHGVQLAGAKIDPALALPWVENQIGIKLANQQKEAVRQALSSKVMVITGGPGTGKTTITRAILTILKAKHIEIALCSPTGRAAKRLSECTGMEAKTIHRLLKFDPKNGGFLFKKENPLPVDLLLVDEASMVDISLMYSLLKAIPPKAALILVGDVDQLPSVGPGTVLKSIIDSRAVPTVRLDEIFRQVAQSRIIVNAHLINKGLMPKTDVVKDSQDSQNSKYSDFYFINSDEPEASVQKLIEVVKNRIPKSFGLDPIRDIQVLCPMNRGLLGTRNLNLELQKALNPDPAVKIERFGNTYAPGDKVMVTANDYDHDVFNGDIGLISKLDTTEQEATIDFDGRLVTFDFSELDIVTLAYATTVHKAQGSEYPAVVIPMTTQHFMMLKKNLVYTGVTRAKKLLVMIGQKKALAMAIKAKNQGKRWGKLASRLGGEI